MYLKHFNVARSQIGVCVLSGGSLEDGSMASACGMNRVLAQSPWQILQWRRKKRFFQCFIVVPFMKYYAFRSPLLILQAIPGIIRALRNRVKEVVNKLCISMLFCKH